MSLLFREGSGGLSTGEQIDIARSLALTVSPDATELLDGACGLPVSTRMSFPDLNGDGGPEVVVDYGNACTSGMAGTSVALFVKDPSGHYRLGLGVTGLIAEVRTSTTPGFADLLIGGPGFCFGVWHWNGREYAHVRNEPQAPGGCGDRRAGASAPRVGEVCLTCQQAYFTSDAVPGDDPGRSRCPPGC